MKIKQAEKDIKASPQSNQRPSTLPPLQLQRYQFSEDITQVFKKIINYDPLTFYQFSTNELKTRCKLELQRMQQLKAKDKNAKNRHVDNELSIIVISNHINALMDLRREGEEILNKLGSSRSRKGQADSDQTRENLIIRKYEGISGEIQKNEAEIRKFMDSVITNREGINFVNCYHFFCGQIRTLKKQGHQKLILSRANMIQTLVFFLREAIKRWQPEANQQLAEMEDASIANGERQVLLLIGNKQNGEYPAHETLTFEQINKWGRFSSKSLEDKMIELSGICQQIPQLQIFNRTLQFSQLSNREKVAFLRVVDVLISLHHRVSYLSRNKPQLMNELEIAQEQILFINICCQKFGEQIEKDLPQILPISFDGFDERKKSQLTENFIDLKHYLIKLSEIIISQDQFQSQLFNRISNIINIVHLYSKVFLGEAEGSQEWDDLVSNLHKEGQLFSDQERNILVILQRCMEAKINNFVTQKGDNGLIKTNDELQDEVNKLIEDYERLKAENKNLGDNIDDLNRGRDQLLLQIQQRDIMIKNLSTMKFTLEKKLGNQETMSNHSNRTDADKQKLLELLEIQRQKYLKISEALAKIKPEKQKLEIEIEALNGHIQSITNDNLRHSNLINRQVQDLTNDNQLLIVESKTAHSNQLKLMERLQTSQRKNAELNKLIMMRLNEEPGETHSSQIDIQRLKKELASLKLHLGEREEECSVLREENASLKLKLRDYRLQIENHAEREDQFAEMKKIIDKRTIKITNLVRLNDELVQKQSEFQSKTISYTRRIKELETRAKYLEDEKEEFTNTLTRKGQKIGQLQNKIRSLQDLLKSHQREKDQMSKKEKKPSPSPNQNKQEVDTLYRPGSSYVTPARQDRYQQNYSLLLRADKEVQTSIQSANQKSTSAVKYDHFFDVKEYERLSTEYNDLRTTASLRIEELQRLLQQSQQAKANMAEKIRRSEGQAERRITYQPINLELRQRENAALKDQLRLSNEERRAIENEIKNSASKLTATAVQLANMTKQKQKWQNKCQELHNNAQLLSKEIGVMKDKSEEQRLSLIKLNETFRNSTLQQKKSFLEEINYLKYQLNTTQIRQVQMGKDRQSLLIELERLQSHLHQSQERCSLLDKDNLNLQRQLTEQSNSPNQLYQLQELRRKFNQTQQVNDKLIYRNQELENECSQIIKHFQQQILNIINQKDTVINNLILQINQLQLASSTIGLKPEDQEKLSRWEEREIFIREILQHNQQLTNDNSLLTSTIRQMENDIQQIILENKHLKDENINHVSQLQLLRQQFSLKQRQYKQNTVNLNIQITNVIGEKNLLVSQHQGILVQLQNERNKSMYLEEEIRRLLIELKNNNIQYYLQKIRSLEEALDAVRDELNYCKTQISRLEGKDYSIHQNITIQLPQQIMAENTQLKAALQRMADQWSHKQRYYLQELESMSNQLITFKEAAYKIQLSQQSKITISPRKLKAKTSTYDQKQLHSAFKHDVLSEQSLQHILNSIGLILEASRRWQNINFWQSLQNWGVPAQFGQQIEDIRNCLLELCDCSNSLRSEYIRSSNLLARSVNMDNLIQYVVRILCVFSQVNLISPESNSIRTEVVQISSDYTGGLFFTVLEEYTIDILQNNAIERYRRELQIKSNQLQGAKNNLEEAIAMRISYEQQLSAHPIYSQREAQQAIPRQSSR